MARKFWLYALVFLAGFALCYMILRQTGLLVSKKTSTPASSLSTSAGPLVFSGHVQKLDGDLLTVAGNDALRPVSRQFTIKDCPIFSRHASTEAEILGASYQEVLTARSQLASDNLTVGQRQALNDKINKLTAAAGQTTQQKIKELNKKIAALGDKQNDERMALLEQSKNLVADIVIKPADRSWLRDNKRLLVYLPAGSDFKQAKLQPSKIEVID